MRLSAGKLNRRIRVVARAAGSDDLGQANGAWTNVICRVWANYMAPSGMGSIAAERITAGQELSTNVCSWRIRYRTDITHGMRVEEDDGTIWDIRQVLPDRMNREHVDLVCVTGASEG